MGFPVEKFQRIKTPFYYYDKNLLQQTLDVVVKESGRYEGFFVHYAVKANVDPGILTLVRQSGLGCDCVSGGEIQACLNAGFAPSKIVFAGVGKADWEIDLALASRIGCFNVESLPELEVINERAAIHNVKAKVAFRVNPNVDAHTHKYITTGLSENKFGIAMEQLDDILTRTISMKNIIIEGLHFHIGSQLLELKPFEELCERINELQERIEKRGIVLHSINVGGGFGVDYTDPDAHPIPDFAGYFETYHRCLKLRPGQQLHFELGRALVCQCGSLISRVLYVKEGLAKKFVILDAGMSDLIRPALYGAHHKIENLTSQGTETECYDVVGPVCESSDTFGKDEVLPITQRGDLIALRSAGAYGQIMASQYNCRRLPGSVIV